MIGAKVILNDLGYYFVKLENLQESIIAEINDADEWAIDGDEITIQFVDMGEECFDDSN